MMMNHASSIETKALTRDDDEEYWDEEEIEWRRIEQNKRTCLMRRTCACGVLLIYAFLILNWRLGKNKVPVLESP